MTNQREAAQVRVDRAGALLSAQQGSIPCVNGSTPLPASAPTHILGAFLGLCVLATLGLAGRSDLADARITARIVQERNAAITRGYVRAWTECLQGVEQHFDDGRQLWVVPCDTYVVRTTQWAE